MMSLFAPPLRAGLALLALCSFAGSSRSEPAAVPRSEETKSLAPWHPVGKPERFTRDTLWDLMDGGAEVYREYGVSEAVSARYENGAGGSVQVEIYTMQNPESAYGIFSFSARGGGQELELGDAASLAKYYLLFAKGRRYVSLTAEDAGDGGAALCLELARKLEATLPSEELRSALLERVAALPRSKNFPVYLKGSLALLNLYPFGSTDPFKAAEGVCVADGETLVFLLRYADEAAAKQAAASSWEKLSSDPRFRAGPSGAPRCLIDEKGRTLILSRKAESLFVAVGPSRPELEERLARIP